MPDTITNTKGIDYLKMAGMVIAALLATGLAAWPHNNNVTELSGISNTAGYNEYFLSGLLYITKAGFYTISFILALFIFTPKATPLFWQVTTFTVANFIAILLSINGFISPPLHGIAELVFLITILFVSLENIFSRKLQLSRFLVIFLFGFFHGMDFIRLLIQSDNSGAFSLSAAAIFSSGLEIAQLALVLPACFLVHKFINPKPPYFSKPVLNGLSLLITFISLYWIIRMFLL